MVHDRDRRVGRGCPPAGRRGAWRPPGRPRPLDGALRGHHPPDPGASGSRGAGRVIGAWLADRDHPGQRRRAVAVDGKTLRGARRGGRQVHLLAAMEHTTRRVLAQREVDGAPGEVPGLKPLLERLDLAGTVVTADALQTHAEAADFLVTVKQAHDLFTIKANQPTLLDRCNRLAWHNVPVLDHTRDQAHGRPSAPSRRSAWVASEASRTPPRSSR